MNEFKIGDVVCLTFDKSKRFLVESTVPVGNEIWVKFFSEIKEGMVSCKIEIRYLEKVIE